MASSDLGRKAVRVRIEGFVQGVGFRDWVDRNARALGLEGWVRNRRDGTVEAVFAGPADRVDAMIARCRQGPRSAHVRDIRVSAEPHAPAAGFTVEATA
jgi:acylphosphatase